MKERTTSDLRELLQRLRQRIRRYVLLEGVALLLVTAAVLFWVSLGIDWAYFQVRHLELPRWFRASFTVLFCALLAGGVTVWIVLRLLRSFRDRALALVLERRFPELDCRLITAVEMTEEDSADQPPLTRAMLRHTIDEVSRAVRGVDLDAVFEKKPLRRALVLCAVLLASVGGLAVANADAIARWKAGYLELADEYWQREYQLQMRVVAQPGDRVREFTAGSNGLDYKHPRGGELALLVDVPEGTSPAGRPWKIPERVEIDYYVPETGERGQATCFRTGDREFRHNFGVWSENLEISITGGDFTNRFPYRITIVDPPRVESVVLDARYPPYMRAVSGDGRKPATRERVPVRGTRVALPHETDFVMQVATNKPLLRARLLFGSHELVVGVTPANDGAGAWTATGYGLYRAATDEFPATRHAMTLDHVSRFFSADRRKLSIPFVLTAASTQSAKDYTQSLNTPLGIPIPMLPDSELTIYLEDEDEIIGDEPARLLVNGIADEPPTVATRLRGIGSSITRKAVIPIEGRVTDDYGIAETRFDFLLDGQGEWMPRPLRGRAEPGARDFTLQWTEGREFERFDVLPLELKVGQTLGVTVTAEDQDDLNGPHVGNGERYTFTIVTDEELLSVLYQRELNLRQRFERIIEELKEAREELRRHHGVAEELATLQESSAAPQGQTERLRELRAGLVAGAERALLTVRKDANETAAVEESFRHIREELVNNAVHTPQILERLDDRIISPLHAINSSDYHEVDGSLGLLKLALEQQNSALSHLNTVDAGLESLLARMDRILLEMRKLETFQEAMELLKGIIEDQETLSEQTQNERKRQAIRKLQGLGIEDE